jgi:hypothetical protein
MKSIAAGAVALALSVSTATVFASIVYLLPLIGSEVVANVSRATASDYGTVNLPFRRPCSEQAWPYYESRCLRDARQPAGRANSVRVVTADRLQIAPALQVAMRFVFTN